MAVLIDLKTIGLQDALDLAVLIEEEARVRYLELADQMIKHDTIEPAKFFQFMAGNELKHRDQLADQRKRLFADAPAQVTLEQLYDVEAPDYDDVRAYMSPRAALQVALKAEEKAEQFFSVALREVRDHTVKDLFQKLRDEETEHRRLVYQQLTKTPEEGPITLADTADEDHAE